MLTIHRTIRSHRLNGLTVEQKGSTNQWTGTMSKPKILIVDDDADLQEILKDSFEAEGYFVRTADDGERALEIIEQNPPDVVVLDFRMPKVNGLEVLKRIKGVNPGLPVIMITAYGRELNVSELTKEGMYTLLIKPLDPNRVRMCVEKALEERNLI